MRGRNAGAALVLCAGCLTHSLVWAQAVTIYTTTFLPPVQRDGHDAAVVFLDDPERMLQALSRQATAQAGESPQVIARRVMAGAGPGWVETFSEQVNALVWAWRHGIEALPAIVVDDRYVLYGLYSVAEAQRRVDAHRQDSGR